MEEEIKPGRIQEVDQKHFAIKFLDGSIANVYFEDLPYLEDCSHFHVGDVIKVRVVHNQLIPVLSRPRYTNRAESNLGDRKVRNRQMMNAIDFRPLKQALPQQIAEEYRRITK